MISGESSSTSISLAMTWGKECQPTAVDNLIGTEDAPIKSALGEERTSPGDVAVGGGAGSQDRSRAMSTSDYRTLIDRGRKAGLRTAELYQAIVTHRSEGFESTGGQADCNGFISCFDTNGQRVYRPVGGSDRG